MLDGGLVSPESLRAQLRLLKKHYRVISPEHFLAWLRGEDALPPLAVLLTCDDGLKNVMSAMLPVLHAEELRCLFFVTGASVENEPGMLWYEELYLLIKSAPSGPLAIEEAGIRAQCPNDFGRRAFWWDLVQAMSELDPQTRRCVLETLRHKFGVAESWRAELQAEDPDFQRFFLLSLEDVRKLAAEGMSIGAHTQSHPLLARLSDIRAQAEICQSRELLADALGLEVWALAYPFGDPGSFRERDIALAQKAKFSCAFTNWGGGFGADLPHFALPRVQVTADMNLGEFEAHVAGLYRSLHWRS
jgi:peptidoglycan/xylan/chitin deacetylase (PgdA/CDA1 family)